MVAMATEQQQGTWPEKNKFFAILRWGKEKFHSEVLKRKDRPTSRSLKCFWENNLLFFQFFDQNAPLNEARGWSLYFA